MATRTKDERDIALLKAQQARDKIFKLVVKIISWETGSLDSIVVKSVNKITDQEWLNYKKYTLSIPTSMDTEKVKEKLAQTFKNIKENNGFKKSPK